ncbi:MAG: GAF domain-containing protein [Deltaproteobacteria bacterium]|nr:GAF domain-containing protein [Deltaproteobacteria bacterium]MBN2672588.1 GAF domain-containing protein [Deltaproteobacteria bacterium]
MTVTYKQLGEGCRYTISPMFSGTGDVLTLSGSKRREPVRSGLLVNSDTRYALGTLVQMDIKFPGQNYTYRAKGIVSWVEDEPRGAIVELGITITGMDKLDKYGISVSISEQDTPPPRPPEEDDWNQAVEAAMPLAPPEPEDDVGFDDTQENPIFDSDFGIRESLIENGLASPDPMPAHLEVIHEAEDLRKSLSPEEISADTLPPPKSEFPEFYNRDWDQRNAAASHTSEKFDVPTVHAIFQTLSLLVPEQAFGERVFFEDVFLLSREPLPRAISEVIEYPGKRADFQINIQGRHGGAMCVILPRGDENTPPSAYAVEQLFLMYTGMEVQVVRNRDTQMELSQMSCTARLAADESSMRAVCGFDEKLLANLVKYKDGPVFDDEPSGEHEVLEELAFDDRTSRVSLVVAESNELHRKSVPIEARISVVPPKVAGPLSVKIDNLVVDAFQSMEELYGSENHDEAAKFALSLSRRLIKCEAAICALMAPGKMELYIAAIDGAIPETRLGARLSLTDGLIGFCMRTGKVARSDKPHEIKESLLRETGLAVDSIMCAPITNNNQNIGTLELINSTSRSGFTREKADLLAYIANSLGEFLTSSLPPQEPTE